MNKAILGSYEITGKKYHALDEFSETISYLKSCFEVQPWEIKYAKDEFYALLLIDAILTDERDGECILSKVGPSHRNPSTDGSTNLIFTITEQNYDRIEELIGNPSDDLAGLIQRAIKYEIIEKSWEINLIPQTEEEAKASALALAARLCQKIGGEWQPRVWENMGWHFGANFGTISVSGHNPLNPQWNALVSDEIGNASFGAIQWSVKKSFSTPEAAVKAGMKAVADHIKNCQKVLEANTKDTKLSFTI